MKRSDSDETEVTGASDNRTLQSKKARKNSQKYRQEYTKEWPCLVKSSLSQNHVYCSICCCDFSVVHGGRDDCRRHMASKKHMDYSKRRSENKNISTYFTSELDNSVIAAEVLFARFLVEHNIPLQAADHTGNLFRKMFPDSEIAKKYGSGRTKTTALIQCLAEESKKSVMHIIRNNAFSIATDASNDISDKKLYPLVVTYFSEKDGQMVTTALSLLDSNDSTGEGIFNLLDTEFCKLNIKWENCVSFGSDNASNMLGKVKGVAAFLEKKYPHIKIIGCPCHLIHRAVQKATKEALPVDIELLIIQIFYYLEKSSKRKHEFVLYQQLYDEKTYKMLKHVSTRWLSLENALKRVLEQWEPLKCFFNSRNSEGKNAQYKSVTKMIEDPNTKLFALFLKNVICIFNKVNLTLQKEKPTIQNLKAELQSLFFDLIVRFVKPTAVSEADTVLSIKYRREKSQKDDEDLVIGSDTRTFMNENDISEEMKRGFFSSVKKFFCVACDYILKKFPLEDDFIQHSEVANIQKRSTTSFKSVQYFVERYPNFLGGNSLDLLEVEFAMYQVEKFSQDIIQCDRVDVAWNKISMLTNYDGTKKYKVLPKVMLSLLTAPHSNAPTERVFSMVRKNQTEFRSSLGVKTLEALLIEKLSIKNCYDKTFTQDELRKAKSATYAQKLQ